MLYVARWLYDCRERIPRIYPWGECQLFEDAGLTKPYHAEHEEPEYEPD